MTPKAPRSRIFQVNNQFRRSPLVEITPEDAPVREARNDISNAIAKRRFQPDQYPRITRSLRKVSER